MNHEVIVLCNQDYISDEEKRTYRNSVPKSIKIYNFTYGKSGITPILRVFETFRIIRNYNPTNVIATGRFQLWIAALAKFFFRDIIFEGFAHGSEVTNGSGMNSKITYLACGRLDKVWAVSSFTSKFLLSRGLRNIEILPNGVDSELLEFDGNLLSKHEGWKGNPSLLTVGNVTYRKGQHRVIKALPKLLQKYPELHYHIVGLPTKRDAFLKLAESLGVSNSITFHGRMASRTDLMKTYKSSDIFIMLSENQPDGDVEGFGIALLEANVFKVPTIGAMDCGIEDAISENSGILVDGNNEEEVLYAIDKILINYTRYQEGARVWAEKHNWSEIVLRME